MILRALLIVLALAGAAAAAPPDEAIMALDKYTTEKGKTLGIAFGPKLRRIYDTVYHCRPWLDVHKSGLGFSRPAGAPGDDRYLNVWVSVDQKITPEFAALPPARRASAMFSRHGVDLLRQLAADAEIFGHPALTGYSVILTWLKPGGRTADGEKTETLGVFADKASVRALLARRMGAQEFVKRATIVAFDGQDRLGRLPLEIWEDNFASTYRPAGYEPDDKHARCKA